MSQKRQRTFSGGRRVYHIDDIDGAILHESMRFEADSDMPGYNLAGQELIFYAPAPGKFTAHFEIETEKEEDDENEKTSD